MFAWWFFGFLGFLGLVFVWLTSKPNAYIKDRKPNPKWWQTHFPERDWPITQSVMEAFGDSFLLGPTGLDKLQPSDRLSDIYRTSHPAWIIGEAMEFESLSLFLSEKLQFSEKDIVEVVSKGSILDILNRAVESRKAHSL